MSGLVRGVALAVMVGFPLLARGNGLGLVRTRTTVAYYCPAPVQYVPLIVADPYCIPLAPPVRSAVPQPSAPSRPYARPTPAPPSSGPTTAEPPLAEPPVPAKPSPAPLSRSSAFGEPTSFYDAYAVASQETPRSADDRYKVDFLNLTDRDLMLKIDGGPAQVLPRGKPLSMAVGRQFTWQVEGREAQSRRVEESERALQIVIRR
jgi:hypothetical protein